MAEKDRDEEQDEGQSPLTPEQRIAKLEKSKTLSLILIVVLAVFSITSLAGIGYLFMSSGDDRPGQNQAKITAMDAKLLEMEKIVNEGKGLYLQSQLLQAKTEQLLSEADINNFANLRQILAEQEQNYSQFIRTLEQGMYELSRMVRGSRTWYDVYKEDLDKILKKSSDRTNRLEGMKPIQPKQAN
ncbi:MAG: hypothetical protein OQK12_09545 [Motiliproteus sp.]|nr:hypothetical protein [Motiliproteus sp.]MCW9051586.1 hypothetical protein [Motiliproteus sp.]